MVPISPILEFAIKKQLNDIGADSENLTDEQAVEFIDKMTDALILFLGYNEAVKARKKMTSLLRVCAPDYFEEQSLI